MARTYEERLASAFKQGARATYVEEMIAETGELIAATRAAEQQSRARSLDPGIPDADALAARRLAEEHAFATERLEEKRDRLQGRLRELIESDRAKANASEYEAAAAENAALAQELSDRVPAIFSELASLFDRIEANDARIEAANQFRPGGSPGLMSAEYVARKTKGQHWPPGNVNPVARLTKIKLPNFDTWGYCWPIDRNAAQRRQIEQAERRRLLAYEATKTPEARAAAKAREEARWAKYSVRQEPYLSYAIVQVAHRHGTCTIDGDPTPLWMNAEQVEAARRNGIVVELAPLETVE